MEIFEVSYHAMRMADENIDGRFADPGVDRWRDESVQDAIETLRFSLLQIVRDAFLREFFER